MTGDRHAAPAIPFRDEELVPWVKQYAKQTGMTAADILRIAVASYRTASEKQEITR